MVATESIEFRSIIDAALAVLREPDPWRKADLTDAAVAAHRSGRLNLVWHDPLVLPSPPRKPSRQGCLQVVKPNKMPKLGKGGTLGSRQAILHSLAHIESWAIDLSWDIIARFGADPAYCLPHAFCADFVQVAADECRHFRLLAARLVECGSQYGALPVHDALWESAEATAHSLPARLAVEHCVHEARGLDVLPSIIAKFRAGGDADSAAMLEGVIYPEEVSHCAAGVRWLRYLFADAQGEASSCGSVVCCGSKAAAEDEGSGRGDQSGRKTGGVEALCGSGDGCGRQHGNNCGTDGGGGAAVGELASQLQASCGVADRRGGGSASPATVVSDGAACCGDSAGRDWRLQAAQHSNVQEWFHMLVQNNFYGGLKPPFNESARTAAGFDADWYMPLVDHSAGRTHPCPAPMPG